jgi:hypothetical protein
MQAPRYFSRHRSGRSAMERLYTVLAVVAALAGSATDVQAREPDPQLACLGGTDWSLSEPSEVHVLAGLSEHAEYLSESATRDLLIADALAFAAGVVQPSFVVNSLASHGSDGWSWPTVEEYFDQLTTRLESLRFQSDSSVTEMHLPWHTCVSWRSATRMLALCRSGDVIGTASALIDPLAKVNAWRVTLLKPLGTSHIVETESHTTMSSTDPGLDLHVVSSQAAARLMIIDLVESNAILDLGTGNSIDCHLIDATVRALPPD